MKIVTVLKQGVIVIGSLGALVLILLYMGGAFHDKIEPERLDASRRTLGNQPTDIVHQILDTERVEIVGTLRAERRTEISSKIMASIQEFNARAGGRVEKGVVLVRLDDRDLKAQLEQARQAVAATEAAMKNAEQDFKRNKDMLEQKVISQQQYDAADARLKVAQAELNRAREAVSSAETMLSYTVIESPFAGVVVDKLADAGDTASPGRPLLVLYDPSAFRLEAAVPEALASSLEAGGELTVRLDTLNTRSRGKIVEIVPQAEAASRSVLVKVSVPHDPRMVEGMFGRLLIPSRERIRYCLPLSAVRPAGQLRFVDVVGPDGALERRQIKLGEHSEQGRIEVLTGVEAGERVVLYGPAPPPFPTDSVIFRRSDDQ